MDATRECVKELLEIAGGDYFLAKAIVKQSNLKFDYSELDRYLGSRSTNIQLFLEFALDYLNSDSINKKELMRDIKGTVLMRKNSCIYILLTYKRHEISVSDFIFFRESHSWPCINELMDKMIDEIPVSEKDFDFLVSTYCKKGSDIRDICEKFLLRLPKEYVPRGYISSNKMNAIDYLGKICRLLMMKHYESDLSNDDLIKMFRKDYGSNHSTYMNIFRSRIKNETLQKSFVEKYLVSEHYNLRVLAHDLIPEYPLSHSEENEIKKFCKKHSL